MFWLLRRSSGFHDVVLSIADQAVLAGGSVALTAVTAFSLEPAEFGEFTIAWSIAILCEGVLLKTLLDDPLPSVAARLSYSQRPELRTCLLLWSILGGGLLVAIAVLLGIAGRAMEFLDHPLLVAAAGLSILATRLQKLARRILYVERRIRMALAVDTVYFMLQFAAVGSLVAFGRLSATTAMLCGSLGGFAAFFLGLLGWGALTRPTMAMMKWSLKTSVQAGLWILIASLAVWAGTTGVIPMAGLVIGSTAGGALRILFLIFAPLTQLNTALSSMLVPRTAMKLRNPSGIAVKESAKKNAKLFGGLSALYGGGVLLGAIWLESIDRLSGGYGITTSKIAWMALAILCEGIWSGLALPLYATGQTRRFLLSRLVALPMLLGPIPLATWLWGETGTVAGIAASSLASLVILAVEWSSGGSKSGNENRSNRSSIETA